MTTYTLIAYKPEYTFWDRGDREILPSRFLKEEELTRQDVINIVINLFTKKSLVEYRHGHELDCLFTEFYIFPTLESKDYEIEEEIFSIQDVIRESVLKIKIEQKEQEKIKEIELKEKAKLAEKQKRKLEFEQLKCKLDQMKKEFE